MILPFLFCNGVCSLYLVEDFEFFLLLTPVLDDGYLRVVPEVLAFEFRAGPFWWWDDTPRLHYVWFHLTYWWEGAGDSTGIGLCAVCSMLVRLACRFWIGL